MYNRRVKNWLKIRNRLEKIVRKPQSAGGDFFWLTLYAAQIASVFLFSKFHKFNFTTLSMWRGIKQK